MFCQNLLKKSDKCLLFGITDKLNIMMILQNLVSIIFPRTCSICGKTFQLDSTQNICNTCLDNIEKTEGLICTCIDCKNNKNIYFDVLKAPYIYSDTVKKLIKKLKYLRRPFLSKDLGIQMAKFIIKEKIDREIDLIVPVPINWIKRIQRGYNQADLLAKEISKIINKPLYSEALIRTKYTKPQFKLNKKERQEHLKGVFALNKKYADIIKEKNILLIDDVATTCSTVNLCSKILKENMSKKVIVVTFARATG